jgi:hypothetical protein
MRTHLFEIELAGFDFIYFLSKYLSLCRQTAGDPTEIGSQHVIGDNGPETVSNNHDTIVPT